MAATITGCTLTGVLGGDTVTCAAAAGTFASASVGTGKTVTATGITLGGTSAANYTLASTSATTTANITTATVTASVTAANKAYDQTTAATITGCTLTGVLGGETVTCSAAGGTFATAAVGTGKTVTATGLTLGGASAANYTLASTSAPTTANIFFFNDTATTEIYTLAQHDALPISITGCSLTGVLGGDTVTCAAAGGTFAS